jgi:hypothetical protein
MARKVSAATLRRIRGLLRLATSPEPEEAASARRRAQELMGEHGLDERDFVDQDSPQASLRVIEERADSSHEDLARVVAVTFSISALSSGSKIAFRGARVAVDQAIETYRAFAWAGESSDKLENGPPGAAEAFRACFWLGLVSCAAERLWARKFKKAAQQSIATGEAVVPRAAQEAYDALVSLADNLDETVHVPDALDRLREWAYERGRAVAQAVVLPEAPRLRLAGGR